MAPNSYLTVGRDGGSMVALSAVGDVAVDGQRARFARHGLWEEYRVSLDGIQQDFVVTQPPTGRGLLRGELALHGANVEESGEEMQLVMSDTGRRLAYSRLHVCDASGRVLAARMYRVNSNRMALVVDDTAAKYPVRIDPTFSDANWSNLGRTSGFPPWR
jgi:hypothetical protein